MKRRFFICLLAAAVAISAFSFAGAVSAADGGKTEIFEGTELTPETVAAIVAGEISYSNVTVNYVDEDEAAALLEEHERLCAEALYREKYLSSEVICPTCKAKGTTEGSKSYEITIVGTASICYMHYTYVQICCTGPDKHLLYVDRLSDMIPAHKWGPLDSNQYTHTCTVCGYVERAV